jgi:hypothetical protein
LLAVDRFLRDKRLRTLMKRSSLRYLPGDFLFIKFSVNSLLYTFSSRRSTPGEEKGVSAQALELEHYFPA